MSIHRLNQKGVHTITAIIVTIYKLKKYVLNVPLRYKHGAEHAMYIVKTYFPS